MEDHQSAKPNRDEDLVAADDAVIGRVFRWSMVVIVMIVIGIGLVVWIRSRPDPVAPQAVSTRPTPRTVVATAEVPRVVFTDITQAAGIDFIHENGARGDKLLPESIGGGVAFFDYDNDGDPDLLLVNSTHWPDHAPKHEPPPVSALYENDGKGSFKNVTTGSGLGVNLYGMGVAVGDYDNDGNVDVFLSATGTNRLFRNVGGTFGDVTTAAGVAGDADAWSTSCGFLDYDNDGDLDLFVCNYVQWSKEIDFQINNTLTGIGRAYGQPTNFQGTQPYLYRNNGDGTFTEVAANSGLHVTNPANGQPVGKGLGVMPVDIDRDGWIDLIVANDTVQNFLFHNQGDGTFIEKGALSGLAFDRNGSATGAMGIDAGYYRNDGELGFFIGNFANEMTSLYVSQGDPTLYADEAIVEGIGAPSREVLSFGVCLFDYDLDGRLDLLQVNGHLEDQINVVQPSQHYEQPPQLFWNCGPTRRGCFVIVASDLLGDLARPIVGRGAAHADIDNDGDLDVILTQVGRPPMLLRNDQALGHHWLRVKLIGRKNNRNAIGARIELTAAGVTQRRQVMPTRSYLSQVALPITFGLGQAEKVDALHITWPDGSTDEMSVDGVDREFVVKQG